MKKQNAEFSSSEPVAVKSSSPTPSGYAEPIYTAPVSKTEKEKETFVSKSEYVYPYEELDKAITKTAGADDYDNLNNFTVPYEEEPIAQEKIAPKQEVKQEEKQQTQTSDDFSAFSFDDFEEKAPAKVAEESAKQEEPAFNFDFGEEESVAPAQTPITEPVAATTQTQTTILDEESFNKKLEEETSRKVREVQEETQRKIEEERAYFESIINEMKAQLNQIAQTKEESVEKPAVEAEATETSEIKQQIKRDSLDQVIKDQQSREEAIRAEYEQKLLDMQAEQDATRKDIEKQLRILEAKNTQLSSQLDYVQANGADAELTKAQLEENERALNEKYIELRAELAKESRRIEEESKALQEEREEVERMKREAEEDIAAEKETLKAELERLKKQIVDSHGTDAEQKLLTSETREEIRKQIEEEYAAKENETVVKYEEVNTQLIKTADELTHQAEIIAIKERELYEEEIRIQKQRASITTIVEGREYTEEEKSILMVDYQNKIDGLTARLKENAKQLRENSREFNPLCRIKKTLDKDKKLLRKREAIVAKQQVVIYGVNNISDVDPARLEKLEKDTKQLAKLQQSVANCEEIMAKNKDRYPALENLDKVLRAQNLQITTDIEEAKLAMEMFERNTKKD
ncbi:MAG: hypothetical protein LBM01_04110 [Christensenellaceae bacterium]|jgi:hypothetical protein|nr:hypothetical protein [Christensenellaceae bacterium]